MNPEYGFGLSGMIAVPIAIVVGIVLGTVQGILTAYCRIPAFIVTLGGLFVFRGITQKVSEYDPRVPASDWVVSLGYEYITPALGIALAIVTSVIVAAVVLSARRKRLKNSLPVMSAPMTGLIIMLVFIALTGLVWKMNEYRGIPYQTLVMAIVLVALFIVSSKTVFGRHLYSIGGNVEAARLSGIKVERNIVAAFSLMGLLAGIAGVVWMAQNQGSTKNAGQYYELYAIAAAVIGGTSLMGGRGTILGTFLGGLVMATVIQGMDYTNLENWLQLVVRGSVLVLAVGIDMFTKNPPRWYIHLKYAITKNLRRSKREK